MICRKLTGTSLTWCVPADSPESVALPDCVVVLSANPGAPGASRYSPSPRRPRPVRTYTGRCRTEAAHPELTFPSATVSDQRADRHRPAARCGPSRPGWCEHKESCAPGTRSPDSARQSTTPTSAPWKWSGCPPATRHGCPAPHPPLRGTMLSLDDQRGRRPVIPGRGVAGRVARTVPHAP